MRATRGSQLQKLPRSIRATASVLSRRSSVLLGRRRWRFLKLIAQTGGTETVGEKHKQQADTNYQHWHNRQNQAEPFKLQVHEVGDNQSRLDYRKAQQNCQHEMDRHWPVSQKDLHQR